MTFSILFLLVAGLWVAGRLVNARRRAARKGQTPRSTPFILSAAGGCTGGTGLGLVLLGARGRHVFKFGRFGGRDWADLLIVAVPVGPPDSLHHDRVAERRRRCVPHGHD